MVRRGGSRRRQLRQRRGGGEMLPVPRAIRNLPNDMPNINPTFRRTVNLLDTRTSAAGVLVLTLANVVTHIRNQCYGGATPEIYFFVNSIRAWGSAGDNHSLAILDADWRTSSFDTGSYTYRPKVGIMYPPTCRPLRFGTSTGNLASFSTYPDESDISILINVTVWAAASSDF